MIPYHSLIVKQCNLLIRGQLNPCDMVYHMYSDRLVFQVSGINDTY